LNDILQRHGERHIPVFYNLFVRDAADIPRVRALAAEQLALV